MNITAERSSAEEALCRANRGLRMACECNRALVGAVEESALAEEICRIISEIGEHPLVWVGIAGTEEGKPLLMAAHARSEDALLPSASTTWANLRSGQTPAGIAIRTGEPYLVRDLLTTRASHPLRAAASEQGFTAWFALPLIEAGATIGAMNVYSADSDAFDSDEVKLLVEMAGDLAYGIRAIRLRAKHARDETTLIESTERYRALVENIQLNVSLLSADYRILMTNATCGKFFNRSPSSLIGKRCHKEFEKRDTVCPHCPGTIAMKTRRPAESLATGVRDECISYPVRIRAFPTFSPNGEPTGFIEIVEDITDQKKAQEQLVESAAKLHKMMDGTIKAISSALEMRDPYTAGHERRVAQLACAIAGFLGLSEQQTEGIRIAGFLHDIGKIAVPTEILTRPGKLGEYEMGIIKTHPQFGFDILKEIDFLWPVPLATLQHHERLNGSGYPLGATGDQIIPEARIIAVADVVEAMSSHRPYRPAPGAEAALAEVAANKGILYAPEVVDACTRLFTERGFQFA
jgi:PAS domain S-box-containing protein